MSGRSPEPPRDTVTSPPPVSGASPVPPVESPDIPGGDAAETQQSPISPIVEPWWKSVSCTVYVQPLGCENQWAMAGEGYVFITASAEGFCTLKVVSVFDDDGDTEPRILVEDDFLRDTPIMCRDGCVVWNSEAQELSYCIMFNGDSDTYFAAVRNALMCAIGNPQDTPIADVWRELRPDIDIPENKPYHMEQNASYIVQNVEKARACGFIAVNALAYAFAAHDHGKRYGVFSTRASAIAIAKLCGCPELRAYLVADVTNLYRPFAKALLGARFETVDQSIIEPPDWTPPAQLASLPGADAVTASMNDLLFLRQLREWLLTAFSEEDDTAAMLDTATKRRQQDVLHVLLNRDVHPLLGALIPATPGTLAPLAAGPKQPSSVAAASTAVATPSTANNSPTKAPSRYVPGAAKFLRSLVAMAANCLPKDMFVDRVIWLLEATRLITWVDACSAEDADDMAKLLEFVIGTFNDRAEDAVLNRLFRIPMHVEGQWQLCRFLCDNPVVDLKTASNVLYHLLSLHDDEGTAVDRDALPIVSEQRDVFVESFVRSPYLPRLLDRALSVPSSGGGGANSSSSASCATPQPTHSLNGSMDSPRSAGFTTTASSIASEVSSQQSNRRKSNSSAAPTPVVAPYTSSTVGAASSALPPPSPIEGTLGVFRLVEYLLRNYNTKARLRTAVLEQLRIVEPAAMNVAAVGAPPSATGVGANANRGAGVGSRTTPRRSGGTSVVEPPSPAVAAAPPALTVHQQSFQASTSLVHRLARWMNSSDSTAVLVSAPGENAATLSPPTTLCCAVLKLVRALSVTIVLHETPLSAHSRPPMAPVVGGGGAGGAIPPVPALPAPLLEVAIARRLRADAVDCGIVSILGAILNLPAHRRRRAARCSSLLDGAVRATLLVVIELTAMKLVRRILLLKHRAVLPAWFCKRCDDEELAAVVDALRTSTAGAASAGPMPSLAGASEANTGGGRGSTPGGAAARSSPTLNLSPESRHALGLDEPNAPHRPVVVDELGAPVEVHARATSPNLEGGGAAPVGPLFPTRRPPPAPSTTSTNTDASTAVACSAAPSTAVADSNAQRPSPRVQVDIAGSAAPSATAASCRATTTGSPQSVTLNPRLVGRPAAGGTSSVLVVQGTSSGGSASSAGGTASPHSGSISPVANGGAAPPAPHRPAGSPTNSSLNPPAPTPGRPNAAAPRRRLSR